MRKYLAKVDWSMTAIKYWNFLKYEIEIIIDQFVPLKKQGKRSRKKHLSKEAVRKIVSMQTMYQKGGRHANYKETLNAATTEIRQSKKNP